MQGKIPFQGLKKRALGNMHRLKIMRAKSKE
jgi:hypothetical protein